MSRWCIHVFQTDTRKRKRRPCGYDHDCQSVYDLKDRGAESVSRHGQISSYAGINGSYLNNAFIEKRNVGIHFEMRGMGIEQRRHQLYKVVKPSRYIKICYSTSNIDVYTEGYVETCDINNSEELTSGQISILCPDIYWYSIVSQAVVYFQDHRGCRFPFGKYTTQNVMSLINGGDEIEFTLVIEASSGSEVVAVSPTIYNADMDEYLQITGEILNGDIITVTTRTGNKTVTLERDGVKTNLINKLVSGSTWLIMTAEADEAVCDAFFSLLLDIKPLAK